jgi:thiamine-phosphate diphosphorylase
MKFKECNNTPLGLYPVVDSYKKLEALYECGITTIQLRIKTKPIYEVKEEIIKAIEISNKFENIRLFINDYWKEAIEYGAYGIHLGQEDIINADLEAIHKAGIRLGISSHTTKEIDIALEIEPSYLAIGPIFPTNSKKMSYDSVGIEDLKSWSKSVNYPIVAIGGINMSNIKDVIETKSANGIAMITGVLNEEGSVSKDKTKELLKLF